MEKRALVAIGLSLLVLVTWSSLVNKSQTVANKEVTNIISPGDSTTPLPPTIIVKSEEKIVPEKILTLNLADQEVNFIESKAAIKDIVFKKYKNTPFPLKYGFLLNDPKLDFKVESQSANSISFVHSDSSKRILKKFTFHKTNNSIELEIKIKNLTSEPIKFTNNLTLGILDYSSKNPQARFQDLVISNSEKTLHLGGSKNHLPSLIKFLGLRDQYFCAIIQPEESGYFGFVNKISQHDSEAGIVKDLIINPGSQNGQLFRLFVGPQELKSLESVNSDWTSIIYFGTFDIISQVLLKALALLHNVFNNWGWAIIVLSILVYLLLYPLTLKQMRSMREMQAIQPLVEKIREQHKDNPQKMNKEIMDLYREHKVNPFGGCLPLLLQMPIFFALYNALMRSIVLRGAGFLWIKDLSEPDKLFLLPVNLPILGNELNILPIVMAIGMFFQQKISSVSASGAAAEQQKIMLVVMPVMFGFIFYRMPSGLVLYWLVNSSLMLIFQLRMRKAK